MAAERLLALVASLLRCQPGRSRTNKLTLLNTLVVAVESVFISNANGSNTNGSYTGGNGYTWEYWVCASSSGTSCNTSAKSGEWIMIHQPSTTLNTTMPTVTEPVVTATGGSATAVQIADANGPKVAVFARQGATLTQASFTTTHSGTAQYLIAGLAVGSYSVTLNGSAIPGSPFSVVSGDNTLYFEAGSGAYGISQSGGSSQAPAIAAFAATPSTITAGQSATLSWVVSGNPTPTLSINNGVGTVTGSSQTVTPAVTTTYTLTATNSVGTASANVTVTVSSGTQPPTAPGNLTATAASANQINLSWSASTSGLGLASYIVQRCQGAACSNFAQVASLTATATTYSDTGLTASTSYSYRVQAVDTAGNLSPFSNAASATTLATTASIRYVQGNYAVPQTPVTTVGVAYTAAQTSGDLNVVVVGWNDGGAVINTVTDKSGNTYTRAVGPTVISGVESQSIYCAKNIVAAAAGANTVTITFSSGATNPDVRVLEYQGADPNNPVDVTAASSGNSASSSSGAVTTTNATDLLLAGNMVQTGTTGAGSGFTSVMITQPDGDIAEDQMVTAMGSYNATAPLSPSGQWIMQMVAFRAASTTVVGPTAPGNLTAVATSASQINLSWTASTSSIGVAHYIVQRCQGAGCSSFAQVASLASPATTYSDTTVTASTSYSYRAQAIDTAGNQSPYSNVASATTQTPPVAPGNLTATATSASQINLSWTASTSSVGLANYVVQRCQGAACTNFAQVALLAATATTYSDTGLTASTSYSYRVQAVDTAGNLSPFSNVASATTLATTASIRYVQGNYAVPQTPVTTVGVAYTAAQTSGDLNVVVVGWNDGGAVINTVTDKSGNTYTRAVGPTVISGVESQSIYYAKNIVAAAAGANTVTITFSSGATNPDVRVLEYQGADPNNPVDVTAASSGNSASSSSGAVTTTNATDLLLAGNMVQTGTTGAGSGFTSVMITQPDGDIAEDQMVTAMGSYNATAPLSPSGQWIMQMVAFRAASTTVVGPTAPGNLTAVATSASQINLSWTASTSSVGLANYVLQRCQGAACTNFAQVALLAATATTYSDTGLTASTSYSYRVQAIDTAGNQSPYSSVASATTLASTTATISYVQGSYATPQTPQATVSVTFAKPQAAGDLNVIAVGWGDTSALVNAVTDKSGNTYTLAVGPTYITGDATQSIYYAKNIVAAAAGANAVTVTFSKGAIYPDIRILEYSGAVS